MNITPSRSSFLAPRYTLSFNIPLDEVPPKMNIKLMIRCLFRPVPFALGIAVFSLSALAAAYTAQYAFGLAPCILCIYQRVPFAVNAALGLFAAHFAAKQNIKAYNLSILFAGLVFLINSAIAMYHVGVEQHWWVSAVEACHIDLSNMAEAMLSPPVPCDQIAWQMFGLSMAGYNVIFCGIAGIMCLVYARRRMKH